MAMIRIMMKKWEKNLFPRTSSRRNKERMREIPQTDQDPQHRGQRSHAEDIQEADRVAAMLQPQLRSDLQHYSGLCLLLSEKLFYQK